MDIEIIYKLYFKDVYLYLFSKTQNASLAEDISQDTFLKALKNINKFDDSKDVRAWLFTIARNTLYTYYKREKIYVPFEADLDQQDSFDVLSSLVQKETITVIERILDQMSEPYRNVFILRYYGELSYEEISAIYHKTPGWSRTMFFRAKKKILNEMEEHYNG